ncbi:MAG: 30S ribosome-binding factor RbfA [Bacteroidota bacterium]
MRYFPIMQSKRQGQVAELIKRNFSLVLQGEGSYIYGVEPLVTVTSVQVSPDLSLAKIYLSVWNTDNKQAVLLQLEEEYARLRSSLASRLKRQIRRIPEFSLFIDDTLDEMYRVDRMFDQLYRDGQMPEEGQEKS